MITRPQDEHRRNSVFPSTPRISVSAWGHSSRRFGASKTMAHTFSRSGLTFGLFS